MWRILNASRAPASRSALRPRRTTLLAFALTLAACGGNDGGTGPINPSGLDVSTLDARTDRIRTIFASSVIASVVLQGSGFGSTTFDRAISRITRPLSAARLIPHPAATTAATPRAASVVIPDTLLGKTLVLGPQGTFVVDPTRTGAPSDGIRFVVYALGSTTELGYAQIVDSSSVTGAHLTIDLVSSGASGRVFHATITGSLTGTDEALAGYATNGADSVNFRIQLVTTTPTGAPRETVTALVTSSPGIGVTAADTLVVDGLTAQDVQVMNFEVGGTRLRFTTPAVQDRINGGFTQSDTMSVALNGTPYATIVATGPGSPALRRVNGSTLPATEQDAILRVLITETAMYGVLLIPLVVGTWLTSVGGGTL